MKRIVKKFLSAILVAVMIMTAAPLNGFVGLKLNLDWLNFDWIDFTTKSAALSASGQCGENVYYTFDSSTGLLTISGSGSMYYSYLLDYNSNYSIFKDNTSIKSIVFEDGVTAIGNYAFQNCRNLQSIVIGDGVINIGGSAFSNCTGLKNITIGSSLENVSQAGFSSCNALESITVSDKNRKYDSRNNCNAVIETETNVLALGCKNTVIPNGVIAIDNYAFSNCKGLSSINIPDSVNTIGTAAFRGCSSLNEISLPDNITYIGSSAFENSGIFNNPENWEKNALYLNKYLIQVRSDLCENLIVKDGTELIADGAFHYWLSTVIIKSVFLPNSVKIICPGAFQSCTTLTDITLSDNLEYIGNYAFFQCSALLSINIPNSVTYLGDQAFQCCNNLETASLPNSITYFGSSVFMQCENLTTVNIPNNLSVLPNYIFSGCELLSEITIPSNIIEIGDGAFDHCSSMSSIYIPDTVTSIGDGAFSSCRNLTSISLSENIVSIGDYVFDNCTSLGRIDLPSSLKSIGSAAFCNCSSLEQIIVPNKVTYVGENAFSDCEKLTSVTIPVTVTSDISNIFEPLYTQSYIEEGYIKVYYGGTFEQWIGIYKNDRMAFDLYLEDEQLYGYYYDIYNDEAFLRVSDLAVEEFLEINIPNYIGEYPVRNAYFIGGNHDAHRTKQLYIPQNVQTVDVGGGYLGCIPLEKINVDENNPYLDSRNDCNAIIETATNTLIWGCKNTVIPSTVKKIQSNAFRDIKDLNMITIPNNVTEIGWGAFVGCSDLKEVFIGNGITNIEQYAFYSCPNLAVVCITSSDAYFNDAFAYNDNRLVIFAPEYSSTYYSARADGVKCVGFTISPKRNNKNTVSFSGNVILYQDLDYCFLTKLVKNIPDVYYFYFDRLTFFGIDNDIITIDLDGHIDESMLYLTMDKVYIGARINGQIISFDNLVERINNNENLAQIFFVDESGNEQQTDSIWDVFVTNLLNVVSRAINRIVKIFKKK